MNNIGAYGNILLPAASREEHPNCGTQAFSFIIATLTEFGCRQHAHQFIIYPSPIYPSIGAQNHRRFSGESPDLGP